ncbi:MAG: hypothetical protein GX424_02580 [Clostridiales bacterium]|jgi:hypothetical protein|nr:hypothetical protein [Clostridiales bacterium]
MRNQLFGFSDMKNKKRYALIQAVVFLSVLILNALVQVSMLAVQTISNEILNSTKLSLILFEGNNKSASPYRYDMEAIRKINHVVFASECRPLFLSVSDPLKKQSGGGVYAIDPRFSYYVGISNMKDNCIYFPQDSYPNAENYTVSDPIGIKVKTVNYPHNAPMILHDACFMTENTYAAIVKNLPASFVQHVQPVYILGVDKVQNVYGVVKNLYAVAPDDDALAMYQANGLENMVADANTLLWIMIAVFVAFFLFHVFVIIYLSSSLINNLSRDLMILYLNGLPRKKIAHSLFAYIKNKTLRGILASSLISVIAFLSAMKFLLHQSPEGYWYLILIAINALVIFMNLFTFKIVIGKIVSAKTSNGNISKIIRN